MGASVGITRILEGFQDILVGSEGFSGLQENFRWLQKGSLHYYVSRHLCGFQVVWVRFRNFWGYRGFHGFRGFPGGVFGKFSGVQGKNRRISGVAPLKYLQRAIQGLSGGFRGFHWDSGVFTVSINWTKLENLELSENYNKVEKILKMPKNSRVIYFWW